jgi:hypothetical protein
MQDEYAIHSSTGPQPIKTFRASEQSERAEGLYAIKEGQFAD